MAEGDFAEFEEFGFDPSPDERKLLAEATARVPIEEEVAVALLGEDPRLLQPAGQSGPGRGYGYWPPGAAKAIEYVRELLRDPPVQAAFVAWQGLRGKVFPWDAFAVPGWPS